MAPRGLSRATGARIRQGLALAVAYNALAVPLASAGVLGPLSAAIAMSLSSVVLAGVLLALVLRAARAGEWDDWEGPAWRHHFDEDEVPETESKPG